jgi:hypothetical protein
MERSDTGDFWIKIESRQWLLFVMFVIKLSGVVLVRLALAILVRRRNPFFHKLFPEIAEQYSKNDK